MSQNDKHEDLALTKSSHPEDRGEVAQEYSQKEYKFLYEKQVHTNKVLSLEVTQWQNKYDTIQALLARKGDDCLRMQNQAATIQIKYDAIQDILDVVLNKLAERK